MILSWVLFGVFAASGPPFEVLRGTGIGHRLDNGESSEKHLIETMTGGAAALDFDNDGLMDLFFVNGSAHSSLQTLRKAGPNHWNRAYRNLGAGKFADVTGTLGLQGEGYSMGAAAADFDGDGFTDLFVTGVSGNHLYRNLNGKSFTDVTRKAGVGGRGVWAVAAGWFDFDNDGDLDLFVVNYVQWDPAKEPVCGDPHRTYCHPREYAGLPNQLFRNNGDGTFTDVSDASGIGKHVGKGMGVAFGDIDGDGRLDVFITNDTVPNFLFHNLGAGKFEEVGVRAGVAWNDDGRALSSMGTDFRDVDNDGREDIFYTALVNETFPFLRNLGRNLLFADLTYASRIGAATLTRSGWGAGIFDFDNDGRKDLFAAGGDVQTNTELYSSRKSRQRNLVLWNQPDGTFRPEEVGDPALHRGAVFADLDNDGAIDVVVTRLGEPPVIYRNTAAAGRHWIGFKGLPPGAGVSLDGGQFNRATTASGYASSSDPRVHFGLGSATAIREAVIRWPSGKVTKIANPPADRYFEVVAER